MSKVATTRETVKPAYEVESDGNRTKKGLGPHHELKRRIRGWVEKNTLDGLTRDKTLKFGDDGALVKDDGTDFQMHRCLYRPQTTTTRVHAYDCIWMLATVASLG
jgi:hypothetical protein